jgi:hypothetical protein
MRIFVCFSKGLSNTIWNSPKGNLHFTCHREPIENQALMGEKTGWKISLVANCIMRQKSKRNARRFCHKAAHPIYLAFLNFIIHFARVRFLFLILEIVQTGLKDALHFQASSVNNRSNKL